MMYESFRLTTTGGTALTLDPSSIEGQRFIDGHRNSQIEVEGLGGGSYSVFLRHPKGARFIEHIGGAGENDTVMLTGDRAPLYEAVRLVFSNVPAGQESVIRVTTWPRMI